MSGKLILRTICVVFLFFLFALPVDAFWMWTPETNQWINPKYAVKDTPQEQLEYALKAYEQGDFKKAVGEFQKLIKHYPRAREAAEAQYHIAMISEEQGQLLGAFKNYQVAVEKYPFSERSVDIIKKQYEIGNKLLEGGDNRNKFIKTVVGGDYDVIEVFRAVIKNAPYGEYAAPSQYKIGLYLQEKQMYQEARDEFEKTLNDYPDSEWAQAAKYQIASSDAKRSSSAQYDQKVTEAAIEELKEFVEEYPAAKLSDDAKEQILSLREKEAENNFVIAEFYEKQKKFGAAKIYYAMVVEDYKNTSWASKSLTRLREMNRKIQ
ncbi:MAG: outer membrane protein assembly factor BamD [Candidatus Omnitrophica bacterium]|nr:outer membrane protein assembly factor BamD [Candidatus Omnitrophota bacterium]